MDDVCFVYTRANVQGRLGTHTFDLVLPPLGISYLAAVLERHKYSVKIVDAFAESLTVDDLFHRLENKFRVVGFYCHTANYLLIRDLAKRLKGTGRPPTVVIGGPHPTALPEQSLADAPAVDCAVYGEGELTIVELMDRLLNGKSLEGVNGTVFRRDGTPVKNPPREYVADLDTLPMPAWHLLPMHRYHSFIEADGKKILHVIGSRGCYSDCNYCFSTKIWGPRVRFHSPERTLREVDHLRTRYGIRFFQFFDDIFTLDPKRVKVLMGEFRKRDLSWACSTRVDLLEEEVVKDLKRGGIHHVCLGIETMNDRLLKVINKHATREQAVKALDLCRKHDIRVLGMFILGIPTETTEDALETISFVSRSKMFLAVYSMFTPYPGTNFWHALKDSPTLEKDFSRYCLSRNFSYVEKHRSPEELQALLQTAYRRFYFRPRVVLSLTLIMLKNPALILTMVRGFLEVFLSLLKGRHVAPEYTRA